MRVLAMFKKWWVLALIAVLALSLTSCSKKKDPALQQGYTACDGEMGAYDVWVLPSTASARMYDVFVIPIDVFEGDEVTIKVGTISPVSGRVLVPDVVVYNDIDIFAGTISENELFTYTVLEIQPFGNTANVVSSCELPIPGGVLADAQNNG